MPQYKVQAYCGIDPGSNGGLAIVYGAQDSTKCWKMPSTERDLWDLVSRTIAPVVKFAMIEQVSGYGPGSGGAMFNFGENYGNCRMALIAAGIPFDQVSPRPWQKSVGITKRSKTETKTRFKNRLKKKAQQLFPQENVTLAVCDALLIAEYCRRKKSATGG